MQVALDVSYDEEQKTARAAAVVFKDWQDCQPLAQYTIDCEEVEPYQPGQFFKRELPCLLAALSIVKQEISAVIVDGYVSLGDRPGLGIHLWEATNRQFPIIGVAKSVFRGAGGVRVARGRSRRPLYVTAIGMDEETAAERIKEMHGGARIPTLLKRADELSRRGGQP